MSYNDKDYQSLAKAIVDDFVQCACPLEDGVVKAASDRQMNAYETRRLIEATNLNAHLILFEKMADHKYVEFDVVDPSAVADRLFASPDPADHGDVDDSVFGKVASLNLELPDERWEQISLKVAEKLAAEAFPTAPEPEPEPKYAGVKLHHAVQLTNRVASELELSAIAFHQEYTSKCAELASHFQYLSAMPFGEFEKDAHALLGSATAAPILEKIRELNSQLPAPGEKLAQENRCVVERKEHAKLREVVAAYHQALEYAEACRWYAAQAEPLLR